MIQSVTLPKSTNSKFASLKKNKPQNESLTSLNPPFFRALAVIFREATLSQLVWLAYKTPPIFNWVGLHTLYFTQTKKHRRFLPKPPLRIRPLTPNFASQPEISRVHGPFQWDPN